MIVPRKYIPKISALGSFVASTLMEPQTKKCPAYFKKLSESTLLNFDKYDIIETWTKFLCFILFANRFFNKVFIGIKTFFIWEQNKMFFIPLRTLVIYLIKKHFSRHRDTRCLEINFESLRS